MQALLKQPIDQSRAVDEYLGYGIYEVAGWFLAVPLGWEGDVLEAGSKPQMRRMIWRWWYNFRA